MIKKRIRDYVISQPSLTSKVIRFIYRILSDLSLFFCNLTGYIPSHVLRHVIYRNIFRIKIPSDSIIYCKCRFFKPSGVNIGHNSIIGYNSFLDGRYGLCIGNNVNIGGETRFYTAEHDIESQNFATSGYPIHVNDYVYIGTRVTLLPGVKIGQGAVVASGAVVTKNVEPWTMVGGVPAKFIRNRPIVKYKLNTNKRTYFQ